MIHDRTTSTLALARTILQGVDKSRLETPVRTASLVLLLETLIEVGEPGTHAKMADAAARTVMGQMAAMKTAGG
jgi:hypothetical protein